MGYSKADVEAMTDQELAKAHIAYGHPNTFEVLGGEFARRFPQVEALRDRAAEITKADTTRRREEGTLPPMMDWLSGTPAESVDLIRAYGEQVQAIANGTGADQDA